MQDAMEGAEALYEQLGFAWPHTLREYVPLIGSNTPAWECLSRGEQAVLRVLASIWGAPRPYGACYLYSDLGAMDHRWQAKIVTLLADVCNVDGLERI